MSKGKSNTGRRDPRFVTVRPWLPLAGLGVLGLLVVIVLVGWVISTLGSKPTPVPETVLIEATATQELAEQAITVPSQTPTLEPTNTSLPEIPTARPTNTSTPKPPSPTAPQLGIGSTQVSAQDGMVMVYVPPGEFTMGSDDCNSDERPVHTVNLDAYWIDQTEVTNAQFAAFVADSGYQTAAEKAGWSYTYLPDEGWSDVSGTDWQHPQGPESSLSGLDQHPVVHVSWKDAVAYCDWAGRRLPTEAEWEKAARGTDGRTYPWGDDFDCTKGNFGDFIDAGGESCDGFNRTAPVGSFSDGASPYDALDMAGNVWEWVADWYDADYYSNSSSSNPQGPSSGEYQVARGGGWFGDEGLIRSAGRDWIIPFYSSYLHGFRCALSAASP